MYNYIELDKIDDITKRNISLNYKDYIEGKITIRQLAERVKLNKQNLRDYLMSINLDAGLCDQEGMIEELAKFKNITKDEARDILCGKIKLH